MKKSLMQWDLKSKSYVPLNSIENKTLKSLLNDKNVDYYVKIVEKQLDYLDSNDKILFTNTIKYAIVAVTKENELLDYFSVPIEPFYIRTEEDRTALDEIFDEMGRDFEPEYEA